MTICLGVDLSGPLAEADGNLHLKQASELVLHLESWQKRGPQKHRRWWWVSLHMFEFEIPSVLAMPLTYCVMPVKKKKSPFALLMEP